MSSSAPVAPTVTRKFRMQFPSTASWVSLENRVIPTIRFQKSKQLRGNCMRNWGEGGKYRQEAWHHAGTDLMHQAHLHPPHGYLYVQTAPTSKINEAGAEASARRERQRGEWITRRRRWGASCRRERPTRRTPRRSGSPARGRTRAATGPCDARSSRSSRPCRSRCGGSGPSPA